MRKRNLTIVDDMALAQLQSNDLSYASSFSHGHWIRMLRGYLRMTQAELAKRSDITQPNLAAIESGKVNPHVSTLKRIYEGLSCDLIVVSAGFEVASSLLYQAGCQFSYDRSLDQFTLTGAGQRFRFYDKNSAMFNTTIKGIIYPAQDAWIEQAIQLYGTNAQFPNWYRIRGVNSSGDPNIDLYPTPLSVYTIKVPLVIPQAELSVFDDTFKLPSMMVELGAWAKSVSERGEDGGTSASDAFQAYKFALGDAVSQDAGRVHMSEIIWES